MRTVKYQILSPPERNKDTGEMGVGITIETEVIVADDDDAKKAGEETARFLMEFMEGTNL